MKDKLAEEICRYCNKSKNIPDDDCYGHKGNETSVYQKINSFLIDFSQRDLHRDKIMRIQLSRLLEMYHTAKMQEMTT